MKILISNDDGIYSPGIKFLKKEMSLIAETIVIAPDRNCSGYSNALTLTKPLKINKLKNNYYSVTGTPVDCVHLGLTGLINKKFDIVISGINDQPNLGDDILYSGTIAAAMEGRYLKLPAISLSISKNKNDNIYYYNVAAIIARQLVTNLYKNIFPPKTILNINVPNIPLNKIKGIKISRLGTRHYPKSLIKDYDPRGNKIYWIGLPGLKSDTGPGTDFYAIKNNYISITPINTNLTNYKIFNELKIWINSIHIEYDIIKN
ncbi:5'/3'-nucleotidase SurE [Candidatus Legionella polyplacis]|uniref:5'-nucleotidase SurE n=1 Tax=Candidatus Legionella polyplacis TaxID=2005262 RepID=A0ABZ2GYQ0_9GAMM